MIHFKKILLLIMLLQARSVLASGKAVITSICILINSNIRVSTQLIPSHEALVEGGEQRKLILTYGLSDEKISHYKSTYNLKDGQKFLWSLNLQRCRAAQILYTNHYRIRCLEKFLDKSEYDWDVHNSTTEDDIIAALSNETIDSLVIYLHSDPEGYLRGNDGSIISPSVFKGISQSLRNIILVTCHGKKVVERYFGTPDTISSQIENQNRRVFYLDKDIFSYFVVSKFLRKVEKQL